MPHFYTWNTSCVNTSHKIIQNLDPSFFQLSQVWECQQSCTWCISHTRHCKCLPFFAVNQCFIHQPQQCVLLLCVQVPVNDPLAHLIRNTKREKKISCRGKNAACGHLIDDCFSYLAASAITEIYYKTDSVYGQLFHVITVNIPGQGQWGWKRWHYKLLPPWWGYRRQYTSLECSHPCRGTGCSACNTTLWRESYVCTEIFLFFFNSYTFSQHIQFVFKGRLLLTAAFWGRVSLLHGTSPVSHKDFQWEPPASLSPGSTAVTRCCSSHSLHLQSNVERRRVVSECAAFNIIRLYSWHIWHVTAV